MAVHHLLGPSSADRWTACPGSLFGPPVKDDAGAAAREGTTCHALLEWCLQFGDQPENCLGLKLGDFGSEFPVDEEMIDGVRLFLDTVDDLCAELGLHRGHVHSEKYIVHNGIPNEIFGGTTDCQIRGNDVLVTLDLKYGRKPVYADSLQLTSYSLLALADYGQPVNRVIQVLVQPRTNPNVHRYEPGYKELEEAWAKISTTADMVLKNQHRLNQYPEKEWLNAGPHCQYCKRKSTCTAMLDMAGQLVDLGTFKHPSEETYIASPTQEISTEDLLFWMKRADAINEFLKDCKKTLCQRASQGVKIPGHKLILRWGHRGWAEEAPAIAKAIGLKEQDITKSTLLSPAGVEKVLKERGELKAKQVIVDRLTKSPMLPPKLVDARARGEEVRPDTVNELLKAIDESDWSEQ